MYSIGGNQIEGGHSGLFGCTSNLCRNHISHWKIKKCLLLFRPDDPPPVVGWIVSKSSLFIRCWTVSLPLVNSSVDLRSTVNKSAKYYRNRINQNEGVAYFIWLCLMAIAELLITKLKQKYESCPTQRVAFPAEWLSLWTPKMEILFEGTIHTNDKDSNGKYTNLCKHHQISKASTMPLAAAHCWLNANTYCKQFGTEDRISSQLS